ncbi:penicillin-binding protein 2 [Maribellus luteus]|uniref:Penicillin-binding protein 2 n=1 Tax=Maribellus luteus TaxID=2305463 RepID=A0A399ST15_9BACT|nr:penicillin-binding protein 2 [Maribellus luteus]RIJ46044.1 penicillin-binding protein 2 [Maribellus luteus]
MNDYSRRSYIIILVFILVALVFLIRLFNLQVMDSTYKQYATNNVLREVVQYPARGLIYDRNGELLVYNKTAYDLLVTPREVKPFDTTLFCRLLDITREDLEAGIQKARKYSSYKPSILVKQISPENYAILQEQLYKFEGFHSQTRTLREYSAPAAAHALGYVSEVTQSDINKDSYYKSGDYIGASGIEKTYEAQLRGTKGVKKNLVDVHNRIQGSYLEGSEDVPAQIGKNLVTTLDLDLQLYAEKLFKNKKGAVVAIEPSTGEVLAMVSAPVYDPGLLVGRVRGANYKVLESDSLMPLFNRALQAKYPPGSTFKTINALIGLQEGAITPETRFSCAGRGSTPIRCTHDHISPANVVEGIRESCNPFMWNTFRSIIGRAKTAAEGFRTWRQYVQNFGLGTILSEDFANTLKGDLPSEELYNRIYGKGRWNALTVRSLSIGQGELGATPLQMANVAAIVANHGFYYEPHIVKEVEGDTIRSSYRKKHEVGIDEKYFAPIIEGMRQSIKNYYYIPGLEYCGKTGTIQIGRGLEHGAFEAFAPREEPKIAVFTYVENSKWGSQYAAPIASLMIEKYLNDTIASNRLHIEERMLNSNLLDPNKIVITDGAAE